MFEYIATGIFFQALFWHSGEKFLKITVGCSGMMKIISCRKTLFICHFHRSTADCLPGHTRDKTANEIWKMLR